MRRFVVPVWLVLLAAFVAKAGHMKPTGFFDGH